MSKRQSRLTIGPVEFIDRIIKRDERGEPFTLAAYQRRVIHPASLCFGWLCYLSQRKAARRLWLLA